MPKCQACYDVFPPDFMVEIEGTNDKKCTFCEKGVNELTYTEAGRTKKYTKKQCSKDYLEFLNKIKNSKGVANLLAKGVKGGSR